MSSLNSNLDSSQLSFLKMALGESVFPIPRHPRVHGQHCSARAGGEVQHLLGGGALHREAGSNCARCHFSTKKR